MRRADNIGGPGNFRHVFSLCSGEYHKWSTADDYWHPAFLQEAVSELDRHADVVLCYPMTSLIDAGGRTIEDYADNLDLSDESPRWRFRKLYERIGLCNAHLGLIRREAMQKTRLIAGHKASDVDFLAEMALLGKFKLLPEIRFFRRYHPTSSSWERADASHQKAYYDPKNQINLGVDTWRRFGFQFGIIRRHDGARSLSSAIGIEGTSGHDPLNFGTLKPCTLKPCTLGQEAYGSKSADVVNS